MMAAPNVLMARVLIAVAVLFITCCNADAATLTGKVQTGGDWFKIPLPNIPVKLFEATQGTPTPIQTATSDESGEFTITVPGSTSQSIFFVSADLGTSVQLVAILGPNLPSQVTINELTTVAASYSMAQFYRTGEISGNAFGLRLAAMMNDNLVDVATGNPSQVLLSPPNADQTNSLRSTRALANVLAACTINRALSAYFLKLTTPPGGTTPKSTPAGLANLARDPGHNVLPVYLLSKIWIPYFPGLLSLPDAWTVAVKVNDSGDDANMFGGPGNIAFDANGYAWIANNVIQGQPVSSPALIVLKPNGKPADGLNGTPKSPLTTGGLLGAGFGVTVDPFNQVWVGNFGWGGVNPTPTTNGSISQFTTAGGALSPPTAWQGGPVRAQGLESDKFGNIWIGSTATDSLYVFKNGDWTNSLSSGPLYQGAQCFDVAVAADGSVWCVSGGGFDGTYESNVSRFELNSDKTALNRLSSVQFPTRRAMKGIALDSTGNAWVASQGDSKVYWFTPDGANADSFGGSAFRFGGMDGPWSTAVDGEDHVWVANFGPLQFGSDFTASRVTKLAGTNAATRPQGKNTGDPISPRTGYTLPTAGAPVRLHNGDLLYGPGRKLCYSPMMRLTAVVIDQAGNLWATNNWKPDFNIDALGGNPGGDGIVIFVGLAAPPKSPFANATIAAPK